MSNSQTLIQIARFCIRPEGIFAIFMIGLFIAIPTIIRPAAMNKEISLAEYERIYNAVHEHQELKPVVEKMMEDNKISRRESFDFWDKKEGIEKDKYRQNLKSSLKD